MRLSLHIWKLEIQLQVRLREHRPPAVIAVQPQDAQLARDLVEAFLL